MTINSLKFDLHVGDTYIMLKLPSRFSLSFLKKCRKIPKGQSNSKIETKLTTPWLKKKKTNRQTIVQKTQHRKLKIQQHEPHQKLGVILGAPEG